MAQRDPHTEAMHDAPATQGSENWKVELLKVVQAVSQRMCCLRSRAIIILGFLSNSAFATQS